MGSLRALSLAGLVAASAATSAFAADLLPPPPVIEAPVATPVDFGNWYIRGDVGAGIHEVSRMRSSYDAGFIVDSPAFDHAKVDDSFNIGAGVGYQFNNWFRGDLTGEYRTRAQYKAIQSYGPTYCGSPTGRCQDVYHASVNSAVFLANGYVDLGTWYGVTPFVGAGIGFAHHHISGLTDQGMPPNAGFGYASDHSHTEFAWAVMTGVSMNVTQNLKMELGYRYLDMGRVRMPAIDCQGAVSCGHERQGFDLASHDIRLGFRYMFGETPQPVVVAAPLVRKY